MALQNLFWVKCGSRGTQTERFCPLETVVLDEVEAEGVYIIPISDNETRKRLAVVECFAYA